MKEDDLNKDKAKQYLKSILDTKDSMQELYALNRAYNISLGKTEEYAKSINRQYGTQRSLATEALKASKDRQRSEGDRISLARISNNIEETANDMLRSRTQTQADLLLKQTMLKTGLTDEYAEQAKNYKLLLDKDVITKSAYKQHLKRLKAEQDSVHHMKEEVELTEQIAENIREIKEESMAFKHTFEKVLATSKAIATDPKALGAFFLTQVAEKIEHVNHAMHELVDTGMSAGEAINLMREDFSLMSAMGMSKVADVSKDLVANFGTAKVLTEAQRAAVGEMAYSYGLAGEEAANLTMALSRMPGESKDSAINFSKTAESIGKMKGVIPSQLMKEMAKNAGLMATFSKGGADGFAKAAASAKKMGVELGSVAASAEKLLDFESSINAQMEASVLIGKELNFDKMREASLAGDLNTVMEEQAKIMQQVGSLDQMNVLQKKALADAMGITTEELVKMNDAQKFNNQYFGENSTVMDNVIGKALKLGGGIAHLAKEYGMMALTVVQSITQLATLNALKKASTIQTNIDTAATTSNTASKTLNTTQMAAYNAMRGAGLTATAAYTAAKNIETVSENVNTGSKQRGIVATIAMNAVNLVRNGIIATGNLVMSAATGIMTLFSVGTVATGTAAGFAAVPMLALGAAVLMVGAGIGLAAYGVSKLFDELTDVPIENLLALPIAFYGMASGLAAISLAGLAAMPVLLALKGLGAMDSLGSIAVSSTDSKKDDKINKLITAIETFVQKPIPIVVNLDGNKIAQGTYRAVQIGKIEQ